MEKKPAYIDDAATQLIVQASHLQDERTGSLLLDDRTEVAIDGASLARPARTATTESTAGQYHSCAGADHTATSVCFHH